MTKSNIQPFTSIQKCIFICGLISLIIVSNANAEEACGRDCLEQYMTGYLDALVSHSPARVPVSTDYKYTENGAKIPLGEGLWFGISELAGYRFDYIDTHSNQIAAHVTYKENGRYGLMSVRLRIDNEKITEIETVLSRDLYNATEMTPPEKLWNEKEPVNTRMSREELQKATESYLRAVAFDDGSIAPFDPDNCMRLENGRVMAITGKAITHAPRPRSSHKNPWLDFVLSSFGMGCGEQISTGVYSFINSYDHARFPVVDVERQIVFGQWVFRRKGNVKSFTYKGKEIPHMSSTQFPNENLLGQAFKFKNGKIVRVQGVFLNASIYKIGTGWD